MRRLPFAPAPTLPVGALALALLFGTAGSPSSLPTGPPPRLGAAAVAAGLPTNPAGSWGALTSWPMVTVHSILLPTGKVLQFDGWQNPEPTQVWDPAANTFHNIVPASSIFCSGNATMSDGRVLIAGGDGGGTTELGLPDTNIFDPATETWSRVADMNIPRWYPTLTELPDGRMVAISGNSANASTWADTPEVYDPSSNAWTLLSGVSTSQVHEDEYPFSYLLPNGKIYTMGPKEDVSFTLDVANKAWARVAGASGRTLGSSVMYRPGKILYTGGAASQTGTSNAYSGASTLDLTAASPAWQPTSPMSSARFYHTLTNLADGTVLAVGGTATAPGNATTGVLGAEIWNPATGTWSPAGSMSAARNYHSTALLLPDATVLVSGGGHEDGLGDAGQYSAQIYSPAYLSNGPRPTISSAPAMAANSSQLTLATPDASSVSAVNLVSLGADTHQIDMNQHFVPLAFTSAGGQLTVQTPDTSTAPPGSYMLFIVNGSGVPSVASIVQLGQQPAAPTNVVAEAGNGQASVGWTAPYRGAPVGSYTVTPFVGGMAQVPVAVTGTPAPTSAAVPGLVNGTAYTFSVTASNALGQGPASAASAPVTPSPNPPPVRNGGFELGLSDWATGGAAPPSASTFAHRSGSGAALLGQTSGSEALGDSSLSQHLTVPAGVSSSLAFWYQPHTADSLCSGSACRWDWMEGQVRSVTGTTLSQLFKLNSNTGAWTQVTADLTPYQGQTIVLWFNVHLDGSSPADNTWMYLDDVSVAGTAPMVPAAPAAVTATAGNASAQLAWTAPPDGGSAITSYTITPYVASVAQNAVTVTGTPPATSTAVTGLANGTAYTFTVSATNAVGPGPTSAASAPITPSVPPPPTVPATPDRVSATAGNASAQLSWAPPADGGSAITSYTITPYLGTVAQPPVTVTGNPPGTSVNVGGLSNGSSYTFTVAAANAVGAGAASAPSNPVTPTAQPVSNGGFESGLSGWTGAGTLPKAATVAHSGTGSALIGLASGSEPLGNSTLSQQITVPATGTSTLTFWYQPHTADASCGGTTTCQWDWMEGQLRSTSGATLASLFKLNNNGGTWTQISADLTAYRGQSIVLWFNVHLDGANPADDTWMYLDDVAVTTG